ncbi:hypothetical protein [Pilimelia columellifera]|uniref:Uncharacterized protein n=1 Tax=Pilimelia columellifera subsp. columellifera TaxID=706583 RepID=A0ABN3NIB9_9ACTN
MFIITIDATITGTPTRHADGTVTLRALHFRSPGPALALQITCTGPLADTAAGLGTGDRVVVTAETAHCGTVNGRPLLAIKVADLTITHRIYTGRHRPRSNIPVTSADAEAHRRYLARFGVPVQPHR